jgi:hypothetical protein
MKIQLKSTIWPLAWAEGKRLLRHPIIVTSFTILLGIWAFDACAIGGADSFPVMPRETWVVQAQTHIILLGIFLAANLAILRSVRHGTGNQESTTSLPRWQHVCAMSLAMLGIAILTLLLSGMWLF